MKTRGFTLIELSIATAIIALVAYGGVMTVSRVVKGTSRANDQMTSLREVQNAGYWLSHDIATAQTVTPGDDADTPQTEFLTLVSTDWETGRTSFVYYYYEPTPSGTTRIKRHLVIKDEGGETEANTTTTIAQDLAATPVLAQNGQEWQVTVSARMGQETQTRSYEVLPRPNA